MSSFQAIYRQMRPDSFDGIVGQEAITQTLRNQIITGRINHAYLFCGTRGTGKTSTAKVLARALACLSPENGDACGKCAACIASAGGSGIDILEMDAASNNGVDDVRLLREAVAYPPSCSRFKIYIIDEVHMLSTGAFNALLKTLEEPPAHVVFILATTEPRQLPATILSRCQRFDFRRIPVKTIQEHLRVACERLGFGYDMDALAAVARAGEGSMRDAMSVLDLAVAMGRGEATMAAAEACIGATGRDFTMRFAAACASGELGECFAMIDELISSGREPAVFARELAEHMRGLLVADACAESGAEAVADILEISPQTAASMIAQAAEMGSDRALRAMELLSEADTSMRLSQQPRALLELAVARICRPEAHMSQDALLERLTRLEKAVAEGRLVPAKPSPAPAEGARRAPQPRPAADGEGAKRPAPAKASGSDAGSVWQAVLQYVRKDNIRRFSSLRLGRLESLSGGVARISFPPEQTAHIANWQRDDNAQYLQAAFEAVGCGARVELAAPAGANDAGSAAAAPSPEKASALAKNAAALFGADNIEIRD